MSGYDAAFSGRYPISRFAAMRILDHVVPADVTRPLVGG
jgi:hypothetical protein